MVAVLVIVVTDVAGLPPGTGDDEVDFQDDDVCCGLVVNVADCGCPDTPDLDLEKGNFTKGGIPAADVVRFLGGFNVVTVLLVKGNRRIGGVFAVHGANGAETEAVLAEVEFAVDVVALAAELVTVAD